MYTYICQLCNKEYTANKQQKEFICPQCCLDYKITDNYIYGEPSTEPKQTEKTPSFRTGTKETAQNTGNPISGEELLGYYMYGNNYTPAAPEPETSHSAQNHPPTLPGQEDSNAGMQEGHKMSYEEALKIYKNQNLNIETIDHLLSKDTLEPEKRRALECIYSEIVNNPSKYTDTDMSDRYSDIIEVLKKMAGSIRTIEVILIWFFVFFIVGCIFAIISLI